MKKTDQTKTILVDQLRKTPIVEAACQKVGISRMTFYRWRTDDAEFTKKVDDALLDGRLLVNDVAESQLISAVKDRNFPAIAYWLKHHHSSYKTKIEIDGAVNTTHELSLEQRALMRKAFKLAGIELDEDKGQETENHENNERQ
ncbi:MAG: hypothetical protein AAB536_02620 [Patescibacteria group bacterium]